MELEIKISQMDWKMLTDYAEEYYAKKQASAISSEIKQKIEEKMKAIYSIDYNGSIGSNDYNGHIPGFAFTKRIIDSGIPRNVVYKTLADYIEGIAKKALAAEQYKTPESQKSGKKFAGWDVNVNNYGSRYYLSILEKAKQYIRNVVLILGKEGDKFLETTNAGEAYKRILGQIEYEKDPPRPRYKKNQLKPLAGEQSGG